MEKNKENKKQKKSDHAVETPPPPQVMDPSAPPSGEQHEQSNENAGDYAFQKRKTADREQLTPREES
jgi:hypothetical protein